MLFRSVRVFRGGERELIGPSAVRADHAQKLHELLDEHLAEAMPVAKKIALAVSAVDDNVLRCGSHTPPGAMLLTAGQRAESAPGMCSPSVVPPWLTARTGGGSLEFPCDPDAVGERGTRHWLAAATGGDGIAEERAGRDQRAAVVDVEHSLYAVSRYTLLLAEHGSNTCRACPSCHHPVNCAYIHVSLVSTRTHLAVACAHGLRARGEARVDAALDGDARYAGYEADSVQKGGTSSSSRCLEGM